MDRDREKPRRGHRYVDNIRHQITTLQRRPFASAIVDQFDVRHPFLYRPLVEFCLKLPSEWRVTAQSTKVVLRRALADIVPAPILARTGKGGIGARVRWALREERQRIEELLSQSILAEAGIIEARLFKRSLDRLTQRGEGLYVTLWRVLSLETWLQTRAGLWAVRKSSKSSNSQEQSTTEQLYSPT